MSEKLIKKYKKKIEILEGMLEEKTRSLFVTKEEIEKNSEFVETVINSISEMIISINKDGQLILANNMAKERLSIDESLPNVHVRKILGDTIVDKLVASEGENTQVESKILQKTGEELSVLISRRKLKKGYIEKSGYVYSIIDITGLKEKERIIEDQKVLLIKNSELASLGEMASGIAHEINNPVAIMDGQLRRLKNYLDDIDITKDEKVNLVDKIYRNLKRVVEIVAGIKKISRNGKDDNLVPVKIGSVLDSLKDMCFEKFRSNHVNLAFSQFDRSILILARETQLLQVLMNLVSNSYDAIEELEDKWIKIDVIDQLKSVNIRVIDSGLGIEKDSVEKMFNPFFTTKDVGKGTGIGLSVSKQMMKDQAGSLNYELFNGHTSFCVCLKK